MPARTDILLRELEIRRQLLALDAPRLFRQFIPLVDPTYQRQWFHTLIADRCQDLIEGRIRKLMVFMPPQHGKSQIVSRMLPAWAFGRSPSLKIVGCSYSATLGQQFSRSVQRVMESPAYARLFPASSLGAVAATGRGRKKRQLRGADMFEVGTGGGFYKTQGVCGGLTGTAVDIAIIDDPVKDALEAYSPTYRERVWDWYTSVLMTRLHNESRQLFIMTRWHEDDLAGRILEREREQWTVLSIPAIRESLDDGNPFDPRQPGEALWPERHSLERLTQAKERSPRVFAALYQQHPVIEGGNIVRRDWFRRIPAADFRALRYNEPMHFYLDTAYGKRKPTGNDPSGILAACRIGADIYIAHAQKVWKEMPDLLRFLPEYMAAHGATKESKLHVEPKANGESVVQMLRAISTLNVKETPVPTDSKEVRLRVVSPRIECGRVILVEGEWVEDFLTELCGFPAMEHDEYVDILGYAISDLYAEADDIDYDHIDKAMFGLL